ncbi:MAG: hypothetical protein MUC42_17350 [Bryobacter sp.]|jgi:hypothetical protein|nr:hypothetical protein [Bryobacter sp.]
MRFPGFSGDPITIEYLTRPRAFRRKLHNGPGPGVEVHAASFIRQRRIVLDSALLRRPSEHRRILVHELFHFAWVRLGAPARRSWARLLQAELKARARGDLGWSAELAKSRLHPSDPATNHPRFRRYLSEAFCDTAAWLFAGVPRHPEFTLASTHRAARRQWFKSLVAGRPLLLL